MLTTNSRVSLRLSKKTRVQKSGFDRLNLTITLFSKINCQSEFIEGYSPQKSGFDSLNLTITLFSKTNCQSEFIEDYSPQKSGFPQAQPDIHIIFDKNQL
jgi:hypothetical protein